MKTETETGNSNTPERENSPMSVNKTEKISTEQSDEEYWEEMFCISRGPRGWNIGCGCG